jgi:hypothetical protein
MKIKKKKKKTKKQNKKQNIDLMVDFHYHIIPVIWESYGELNSISHVSNI